MGRSWFSQGSSILSSIHKQYEQYLQRPADSTTKEYLYHSIYTNSNLLKLLYGHSNVWMSEEAFESGITADIIQFAKELKTKEKKHIVRLVVRFLLENASNRSNAFIQCLMGYSLN